MSIAQLEKQLADAVKQVDKWENLASQAELADNDDLFDNYSELMTQAEEAVYDIEQELKKAKGAL